MHELQADSLMLDLPDPRVIQLEEQLRIARQERAAELEAELRTLRAEESRRKARGLPQVPWKLSGIPRELANWPGSFWGIPDGWLDHLKPLPVVGRRYYGPEDITTAMRILHHEPSKVAQDETIVARWKQDRRRKTWGGYYVDAHDGKPMGGFPMPLKQQTELSADDMQRQRKETLGKWSAWVSQPPKPKVVKPTVSLALLRSARFVRVGLMRLRDDVLRLNHCHCSHWQNKEVV